MTEIEKLYEKAGIGKTIKKYCSYDYGVTCPHNVSDCSACQYYADTEPQYPDFTAEKQIELIKWLSDTDYYIQSIYKTIDTKEYCIENDFYDIQTDKFEKTLARLINKLWIDLTDTEKAEVKEILE